MCFFFLVELDGKSYTGQVMLTNIVADVLAKLDRSPVQIEV